MSTLVLLTAAYPFGRSSETFLEAEIPILARHFDRVIILPSHREDTARRLPAGVRCETLLAGVSKERASLELLRQPRRAVIHYGRAIAKEGSPAAYLGHPRDYVATLGRNLVKYRLLKKFVSAERLREAVFYDYWLENSTLALSWLRREGVIHRAVARAHGFDVYDEQWSGGAVPFQAFKLASLDRVFTVSSHGLSHLAAGYPNARTKLILSRLGVERRQPVACADVEGQPLVISCASLLPFKRVEMIPEVLARIDRPLRWIHFGEGPSRGDVERAATALPDCVQWQLAGHIDHSHLLEYYKETKINLFVSLSTSEGLPVSLMEAISFGIPVLAVSVGGVPEIVTAATGRLVNVDDSVESIARAARHLIDQGDTHTNEIIAFFRCNFDAETNFGQFAEMLCAL